MTIKEIIGLIEEAYESNPWHGFGLLTSLSMLSAEQWHQPVRHRTVADLVGHLIAWRNFAIARLDDRTDFPIEMHTESDWPDCSGLSRETLLQQLDDSQTALVATLGRLAEVDLNNHFPADYRYNKQQLALGVMQHDVYHTGQINLLARLLSGK